jgi:uncharacterized protein YndB with AHSA1/START domain
MANVELERTLVKSPPELWDELAADTGLRRWLGEVRVRETDPPHRLEWDSEVASGVIELEASGWGTKVRAVASGADEVENRLSELLDDLGASSLTSG